LFADLAIVAFMPQPLAWHASAQPAVIIQTVALQDDAEVAWDPIILDAIPGDLMAIESANPLAAGLAACFVPDATKGRVDARWLFVHESAGFMAWFLLGIWAERRVRLGWVLGGFLLLRVFCSPGAQSLFWVVFLCWLLGLGAVKAVRRVMPAPAS
jgi:hypothetical protein